MNDRQSPTLLDVAKILDAPTREFDTYPETRTFILRLIHQSAKATALYEELTRDSGDGPTLLELAALLNSFSEKPYPEAQQAALWLIRQSEAATDKYEKLEELAKDTGNHLLGDGVVGSCMEALDRNLEVDNLLSAGDWTDPMDVLDARRDRISPYYEEWISICYARLGRTKDANETERLREIVEKLQRCADIDRYLPTVEERAKDLQKWLKSFDNPEEVIGVLERMLAGLRAVKSSGTKAGD